MANITSININKKNWTYDMEEKNPRSLKSLKELWKNEAGGSKVKSPVFTPAAGNIGKGESVTITCATAGAEIYYTTDGSEPSKESTAYSTPIVINSDTTIKAIAYATIKEEEKASAIATASYVAVMPKVATPVITNNEATVTITCATPDAEITYQINDGLAVTYTGPFTVENKGDVVKAKATKDDYLDSDEATKTITWIVQLYKYFGIYLSGGSPVSSLTEEQINALDDLSKVVDDGIAGGSKEYHFGEAGGDGEQLVVAYPATSGKLSTYTESGITSSISDSYTNFQTTINGENYECYILTDEIANDDEGWEIIYA